MPSPVGHGLAGLSLAWMMAGRDRRALPLTCVVLAMLPDVDVLFGVHRGPTHSLGAVLIVTAGATAFALVRRLAAARVGAACGLAYASHLLLDWLGRDSRAPQGIMAFWPWSSTYYSSGADLFLEISRRYWNPNEVIFGNLRSIGWELVLLLPLTLLAWFVSQRRNHKGHEEDARSTRRKPN